MQVRVYRRKLLWMSVASLCKSPWSFWWSSTLRKKQIAETPHSGTSGYQARLNAESADLLAFEGLVIGLQLPLCDYASSALCCDACVDVDGTCKSNEGIASLPHKGEGIDHRMDEVQLDAVDGKQLQQVHPESSDLWHGDDSSEVQRLDIQGKMCWLAKLVDMASGHKAP